MLKYLTALIMSGAIALRSVYAPATAADSQFGPSNPFYAASTLPFHAPPFDKIKDEDYQPAIEAGMAEELSETQAIADNPAPPTFENVLVAMEKTGRLLRRATAAFFGVAQANTNPVLQKVRTVEARSWRRTRMPSASTQNFLLAWRLSTNSASHSNSIRNRFGCSRSLTIGSSALAQTSRTPRRPN